MSDFSSLITIMKGAAAKASRVLSRDYNELKHLQSSKKSNETFVNRSFEKAKDIMITELERARPEFGLHSYSYNKESTSEHEERWILNVLDGAKNFSHSIPCFAIGIAVEERLYGKTEITSGLIFFPATNEIFFAEKGKGSWYEDNAVRRIRVSERRSKNDLLGVGDVPELDSQDFGCDLVSCAYVASGKMDFAKLKSGYSDIAPGILLVKEAGGSVEEKSGELLFSNSLLGTIIK